MLFHSIWKHTLQYSTYIGSCYHCWSLVLTVSTWQQKTRMDYDNKIGRLNQQLWPRKAGGGVSPRTDLWKHDWTYAVWGGRWGGSLGWMEFKIHLLARQTSKLADGRSDWLRRDQGVKQKMIMQFWWNSCCTLRQNSFCSPCSYFVRADWQHVLIGGSNMTSEETQKAHEETS